MVKKAFLLILLATSVFATGKTQNPQTGPQGPAGVDGKDGRDGLDGRDGDDGSHSLEMPLGVGVRLFDTPKWQGVTSYQYDPLHNQNVLSGLLIYKLGPDAHEAKINALEAQLGALQRIIERAATIPVEYEKPIRGTIRGKN